MPAQIRQQLSDRPLICFAEIDDGAYLCLYDRVCYMSNLVDIYRVDSYRPSQEVRDRFVDEPPSFLIVDRRGRILLPVRLRRRVGIKRDAVLAGCREHLEIWSPAAWEAWTTNSSPGQL